MSGRERYVEYRDVFGLRRESDDDAEVLLRQQARPYLFEATYDTGGTITIAGCHRNAGTAAPRDGRSIPDNVEAIYRNIRTCALRRWPRASKTIR
jgi:hypothetical protein